MIQVGILNAYFPYTLEESARRIRGLGFNTVQLDLVFKGMTLCAGIIGARVRRVPARPHAGWVRYPAPTS